MPNLVEAMLLSLANMKSGPQGFYKVKAIRMCNRCRLQPESCQYFKEYSFLWKRKDADNQDADNQDADNQDADENVVEWPEDVPFTQDELEQLIMVYEDELKKSTDTTSTEQQ